LEKSPRALSLLIANLLFENSLHVLYNYKEFRSGQLQRMRLEEHCGDVIKTMTYPLATANANTLVKHFHKDRLFSKVPTITYAPNVLSLFHNFLKNTLFCDAWLQGNHNADFYRLLEQCGAFCLVDYLLHYRRVFWFPEGLALFAASP